MSLTFTKNSRGVTALRTINDLKGYERLTHVCVALPVGNH
jgi:hypothetical protein